jgi:ESS family glutamate:Na+ symporter
MNFSWTVFVDLGFISAAMLLATFIRARVRFFQRYLIPNALTAGFILLPLYNFVLPRVGITSAGLGELAYHLLSISFVAMSLRKGPRAGKRGDGQVFATSVGVISQYSVQAMIGLLLTLMFINTMYPELFHSFGFLVPLGFALGPGQAYAIGEGWSAQGIAGAGSVGLTFAAVGFLMSCFGGVFLINYGIRKRWMKEGLERMLADTGVRTGVYPKNAQRPVGSWLTTETEAIDSMSFNTGIVLLCYFGCYLLLKFLGWALAFVGPMGTQLATNLWGISFVFACLIALGVKAVMHLLKVDYVLDNTTLNRVSGLSVDVMVTSAIAAISLVVVSHYWLPILVMSVAAGAATALTVPWIASRMFKDHRFHRMLLVFGVSTGTLSTGLALLRVIDPDFETPVATDYTYSSGITFMIVIPFILAINLPVTAFVTGNIAYFWAAFGVAAGYGIFAFISFLALSRRRSFRKGRRLWLEEQHLEVG